MAGKSCQLALAQRRGCTSALAIFRSDSGGGWWRISSMYENINVISENRLINLICGGGLRREKQHAMCNVCTESAIRQMLLMRLKWKRAISWLKISGYRMRKYEISGVSAGVASCGSGEMAKKMFGCRRGGAQLALSGWKRRKPRRGENAENTSAKYGSYKYKSWRQLAGNAWRINAAKAKCQWLISAN